MTTSKNWKAQIALVGILLGAIFATGACGDDITSGVLADASVPQTYQVSGNVSGLSGEQRGRRLRERA